MISQRLAALRHQMNIRKLDAVIFFGSDPHQSEYVPDRWRTREWISGFTGSAGTVVVTFDEACLWSDFRYYIQAAEELEGTDYTFFKSSEPDTPHVKGWLGSNLKAGARVGVNADTVSHSTYMDLCKALEPHGIDVSAESDFVEEIWQGRPALPAGAVSDFPVKYAGKSRQEKLAELRKKLAGAGADCHLVSALDEIAWLLNIRGQDVKHTPVCLSYLIVDSERSIWFVDKQKLPDGLIADLEQAGVDIKGYGEVIGHVSGLAAGGAILFDPDKTCQKLASTVPAGCRIIKTAGPAAMMKCIKNSVELAGMSNASLRDCAAMVKFLYWLEQEVPNGGVTELSVADKLIELRSEDSLFVEPSFTSIAGYREHGALCHYSADEHSSYELKNDNFFLIDSGGQFWDGTTDITRTVPLGPLDAQQKTDFTLVLKAHIQLAMALFPEGTTGGQLEIMGKSALWQAGRHYNHGPGHGIGVCLGVHEGPAGFGKGNPTPLKPGMILTNEPGLYREGHYGIRIENTVTVVEKESNEFGTFLGFETISFCPIDTRAVDVSLLTSQERDWLNCYHRKTFESLSPRFEPQLVSWLEARCQDI